MEPSGGGDDDDEPREVIFHEGFEYEKPWMSKTTLWSCTVPGCVGQLSVAPVRSKRWRHRTVDVHRDAVGGLTARKICRKHNHTSATVGPKRLGDLKVLSRNGKRMRCETKIMKSSHTQTKNIEKDIDSIKDDATKKDLDNAEHTVGQDTKMDCVVEKENIHKLNFFDHIIKKGVEDKNLNGINCNNNTTFCDTNAVQCDGEKKNKTSLTEHSSLFYDNMIEIPSALNKIGSHTIEKSNSKEVNKKIDVCNSGVLKCTDKNKDSTVNDLKPLNMTEQTDLQKTEPLQLLRCKQCYIYIIQRNYQQHINTVAHKIAELYYKSKIVQVIKGHCENDILSTRIISTCTSDSIHDFFYSIEDTVKNLIGFVIQLINGPIKVFIKMFALYQKIFNQNSDSILGDVMTFIVKDEILASNTVLGPWFEKISNTFKLHNQNYLNAECQKKSLHLIRVMFLEIYFFKAPN